MRSSLSVVAFLMLFGLSAPLAHAQGSEESPTHSAEVLAAHRVALANARDRIDELQLELANARRELRRTAQVLEAVGIDPSAEPSDVVADLLLQAGDAERVAPAPANLALLPLGDQVNRLSLFNQALRRKLDERDQHIDQLEDQRRRDAAVAVIHEEDIPAPPAPRWEYTWQKERIYTGETTTITYRTREDGRRVEHMEQSPAYDHDRVLMHGTFRNESQAPYQYTFKVIAYGPVNCGSNRVQGYEWVQTPVLSPGELFCWEVEFGVDDVDAIRDGDIVRVEAAVGE